MIAMYKGISPMSRLIRTVNWSDYSHAAWVDPVDQSIVESWTDGGVRHCESIHDRHTPGTFVEYFDVPATPAQIDIVRNFLHSQIGKPYDWAGILHFASRTDEAPAGQDKWFCSELVFAAYLEAGIPLLARIPAYKVFPGLLTYSPLLKIVGGMFTQAHAAVSTPKSVQTDPLQNAPRLAITQPLRQHRRICPPTNLHQVVQECSVYGCTHLQPLPNQTAEIHLLDLENALPLTQNPSETASGPVAPEWMEVPYADVPIRQGKTMLFQTLNQPVAEQMVSLWNSARANPAKPFLGAPIYKGHPDSQTFRAQGDTDDDAYGWVTDIEAGPQSLRLKAMWNEAGLALLSSKKRKSFSPFFLGEQVGLRNGTQVYAPRRLQSVGLTNRPNWPVAPLVNAEPVTEGMNMELLQELIAIIGDSAINTKEAALSAVERMKTAAAEAQRKTQEAETAMANCETLKAEKTAAESLATKATADYTAERAARATELVNAQIAAGRVLPAERETVLQELCNAVDFCAVGSAIAARPQKIKTVPTTNNLAQRGVELSQRRNKALELVNSRMAGNPGETYEQAFVAIEKSNPELFVKPPAAT